jgi:hypothetical protein
VAEEAFKYLKTIFCGEEEAPVMEVVSEDEVDCDQVAALPSSPAATGGLPCNCTVLYCTLVRWKEPSPSPGTRTGPPELRVASLATKLSSWDRWVLLHLYCVALHFCTSECTFSCCRWSLQLLDEDIKAEQYTTNCLYLCTFYFSSTWQSLNLYTVPQPLLNHLSESALKKEPSIA